MWVDPRPNETLQIKGYTNGAALTFIVLGLRDDKFLWSLGKKAATIYVELLSQAQKYMKAGELLHLKGHQKERSGRHNPPKSKVCNKEEGLKNIRIEDIVESQDRIVCKREAIVLKFLMNLR